ncbi:MAG: SDR family oxidoreductase [Betaproteobacteria bacterium]|nr:SDR family oxidoreductase [Betaproteobacteria bacterium]
MILASQPSKKIVEVEEVAAIAVFLCSDAAASISGTSQSIDGGWTAR